MNSEKLFSTSGHTPKQGSASSSPAHLAGEGVKRLKRPGPRNRFMTQLAREEEPFKIMALMAKGMRVADIAEAMKMSVATLYRRIDKLPRAKKPALEAKVPEFEVLLETLIESANVATAKATKLAADRIEKHNVSESCVCCKDSKVQIELLRQSAEHQKILVERQRGCARRLEHVALQEAVRSGLLDALGEVLLAGDELGALVGGVDGAAKEARDEAAALAP